MRNASTQAENTGLENLGLKDRQVMWFGQGGMTWNQLLPKLQYEMLFRPTPAIIVLHVGGNSVVNTALGPFLHTLKSDMEYIFSTYTSAIIVWSDILPRAIWRGAEPSDLPRMEDKRKRINRAGRTIVAKHEMGRIMTHPDIEKLKVSLLNPRDGTHLTPEGNTILIATYKLAVATFLENMETIRI